ncbi:DTX3L-like protein, partial [Mya arenaria]
KTSTIYTDSASAECVRRKISHITNRRLTPSSPKQAEDHETQFALSSVASGYRMSKEAKFKGKVVSGDVIFCEAPVLSKPKWIAHAVLYLKKDKKNEEERQMKIAEIFTNIFEQAILKGCKSIALPSLGSATSEKRPPTQDTNTMTQKEPRADIRPAPTGNLKIYDDEGITKNPPKKNYNSKERDYKDDDDNSDLEQSDIDDEENEEAFRQRNISQPEETEEICVICMETVKKQKTLPCGHVFCENCIEQQFTYKEACPTCGQVVGTIEGDQPDGTMTITIDDLTHCAGFEHVGQFIITYSFENGKQGLGVHEPRGRKGFGYPDDSYLDRVTDELKAKGVTEVDIVEVPLENIVRRERQHRR